MTLTGPSKLLLKLLEQQIQICCAKNMQKLRDLLNEAELYLLTRRTNQLQNSAAGCQFDQMLVKHFYSGLLLSSLQSAVETDSCCPGHYFKSKNN